MTSGCPLAQLSCSSGRGNLKASCIQDKVMYDNSRCKRVDQILFEDFARDLMPRTSYTGSCRSWKSSLKEFSMGWTVIRPHVSFSGRRHFFDEELSCRFLSASLPLARRTLNTCEFCSVNGAKDSLDHDIHLDDSRERLEAECLPDHERLPISSSGAKSLRSEPIEHESSEKGVVNPERDYSSGTPEHDMGTSVSSHEESNKASGHEATGIPQPEELQNYGKGPDWDEEIAFVTRISVPRQKYIPVSKVDLVNALLSLFFPENKDASNFLSICSYLDLILHAEHKVELEELRADYSLIHSLQDAVMPESSKVLKSAVTNISKLGTASAECNQNLTTVGEEGDWPADCPPHEVENRSSRDYKQHPWSVLTDLGVRFMAFFKQGTARDAEDAQRWRGDGGAREAASERFQKNLLQLLSHAEFEGISVQDLKLTAALNSDYLLTLPVDVDWKHAASSNVKIYRRGYAKEEQKGLLIGAKLDYLQSLLLRKLFKGFTGPLSNAGRWCIQRWNSLWDDEEGRALAESLSRWLQEPLEPEDEEPSNATAELDMPIWMAVRQTVPRYEAVLSSAGSRGLLIRRILVRMGLLQAESPFQGLPTYGDESALEPHLRPSHLSRVSMKDIWLTASKAVVGRDLWSMISAAVSVFFSEATLQEPAFQELVLVYNADNQGESRGTGLQLQIYKKIPLPDLKMVFPSKKLIFRVLDTVRLDITSVAGLLAFTVNYRFDHSSSLSAFLLDLVAVSSLVVFVTRVAFGYKQVWDRYQLLVNKTLSEKTVASGFAVVQFLLDESEEQQFKEAMLVLMILMYEGKADGMARRQLADACEQFLFYRCKAKVEMPLESAIKTLLKLGLIVTTEEVGFTASSHGGDHRLRALSHDEGLKALERHWISILSNRSLWS